MRRKIPAAMGTEQWPLNVQWFSLNTSLVTSVTYYPKGLCTCSIYCSLLFELFIPSKNYFIVRCKYGSLYRVKRQKEKCDKNFWEKGKYWNILDLWFIQVLKQGSAGFSLPNQFLHLHKRDWKSKKLPELIKQRRKHNQNLI